jgi:predicted DNA-binding transcriptional regulator
MLKEVFGGFMSKSSRKFDLAFLESELKGKTLLVYWHLLKSPGLKVGVREVQRKLGFSSPSVAVYHHGCFIYYSPNLMCLSTAPAIVI